MKPIIVDAKIEQVSPLTDSIVQFILDPAEFISYQAGQYLQILSKQHVFNYSIANAPLGSKTYELHIRHSIDNLHTQQLLNDIKQQGSVTIQLPFGQCDISCLALDKPILFIAAGTGFAPVKAMIEQLLVTGDKRSFELFWGARTKNDLYMDEKVLQWQAHVQHFNYFSRISTMHKKSLISMILSRHEHDLKDWQIVMSGPFDMVYKTRDALLVAGALLEQMYSDAFNFKG